MVAVAVIFGQTTAQEARTFSDAGSSSAGNAECAIYNAPLCHPGTIEIFVKRFTAKTGDPTKALNVWLVQGGPGYSSTTLEPTMLDLYNQLQGKVNVYTMDHRGTGRSTRFDCAAMHKAASGSGSGGQMSPLEVASCAKELQFKYGDLSSFSMTSAATDVATFISEYTNRENTIVYGVSYGTALVKRLMHLNTPMVSGYVLDGIATTSGASADPFPYISLWDIDYGEVGDSFLDLCDQTKACSRYFKSETLSSTLLRVFRNVDKNPSSPCAQLLISTDTGNNQTSEPPSFSLRRIFGLLLVFSYMRTLIPPVVHRFNRCAPDDVKFLTQLTSSLKSSTKTQDDAYKSMLLYYLIIFSEMWETPAHSSQTMRKRFADTRISDGGFYEVDGGGIYRLNSLYCAFSKETSPACNGLKGGNYTSNAIIYERDEYWNKSAVIPNQASVLLLSGKLDPQTPHKYAEYLLEVLDGENKELIAFDYAAHGTVIPTQHVERDSDSEMCGMKLLASYVKNSGDLALLDKTSLDKMLRFNWTIPTDYLYGYFGTDEPYNGAYIPSASTQYSDE
ncbi:hypothetical protein L917_19404 [Phytophthora nicotianae]|uniref:Uncharacterized protein n=1 Tax=Phytophthora nicotianae TaxID=4792 RepID=W2K4K5_PHYNI|nr:hypothetical protein L917_19404 [Phytophthora nicotianae]